MDLRVLLPDVDECRKEYWGKDETVCVGLIPLKGLRGAALKAILKKRKRGRTWHAIEACAL
jgi:DNA polymerase III alpha subunit